MPELHLPWLELSILLPLLGAVCLMPVRNSDVAYRLCVGFCSATLLCATGEWIDFSTLKSFEAHDHWDVIELLFHRDVFVVDELSAPLLPLAALIYLVTVLSTVRTKAHRFSFRMTLFAEALLLATLSCREPWLIVALMSIAVLPPLLEIRHRGQSTRVFSVHMTLFVVLLVAGCFCVPVEALRTTPAGQTWTLIGGAMLTAAALLRSGVVPVHCWLTDLFDKATFGTALLFVTPLPGAYLVMRLILPIAPAWALQGIAILSLVTAVYAAAMSLVQTDARRFFCYLFLSHSALVLVGLELVTPIGLAGALCVWLSVGLSLTGFGLTLRSVEARTGRLSLASFHGLAEHMPTLSGLFLLTGLASIGFPGTVGFIGTELLVEGAVSVYPLVGMAVVVAMALNSIAVLHAYFRVFTGTRHVASISLRARPAERWAVVLLAILIVGGGVYPHPGVASRYHAARELMDHRRNIPLENPASDSGAHAVPVDAPHSHTDQDGHHSGVNESE